MRVKLLLVCALLSNLLTEKLVFGSEWEALPISQSKSIPNLKLEANNTSIRISSGQRILATETMCNPGKNLYEHIKNETAKVKGIFTVVLDEGRYYVEFKEFEIPSTGGCQPLARSTGRYVAHTVTTTFCTGFLMLVQGYIDIQKDESHRSYEKRTLIRQANGDVVVTAMDTGKIAGTNGGN